MISRVFFAATMIAIGIIGLMSGGFAPIWQPVPDTVPGREYLAYLCTLVSLTSGAGLLAKRTAAAAALILLVYLLVWTAVFKVPFIIRAPLEEVSYQSTGENLVLVAAAWILFAEFASAPAHFASNVGLRIAYLLYGLALIAFGLSHFVYLNMTATCSRLAAAPVVWAYRRAASSRGWSDDRHRLPRAARHDGRCAADCADHGVGLGTDALCRANDLDALAGNHRLLGADSQRLGDGYRLATKASGLSFPSLSQSVSVVG
jgi:hypothetical protein